MKIHKLNFSIDIKANTSKIWQSLWDDASYREWAKVFFEGSYAVAENWNEGGKVFFLAPDKSGIYSIIEKHIPNNIIMFKHIGTVLDGKEQPIDDDTKAWTGAIEIYRITEAENYNTLTIEIDVMEEHLDFMNGKLPKALEMIKVLSES